MLSCIGDSGESICTPGRTGERGPCGDNGVPGRTYFAFICYYSPYCSGTLIQEKTETQEHSLFYTIGPCGYRGDNGDMGTAGRDGNCGPPGPPGINGHSGPPGKILMKLIYASYISYIFL